MVNPIFGFLGKMPSKVFHAAAKEEKLYCKSCECVQPHTPYSWADELHSSGYDDGPGFYFDSVFGTISSTSAY